MNRLSSLVLGCCLTMQLAGCRHEADLATPDQPKKNLTVEVVHVHNLADSLEIPGHVEANPEHLVHVYAPLSGRLLNLNLTSGQEVRKGQTIAMLQSGDVAQARADFEKARIETLRADHALDRGKLLIAHDVMSQADFQELKAVDDAAHAEQERTRQRVHELGFSENGTTDMTAITAPITGTALEVAFQASVGGAPITQMIEGDRRFDITLRYPETYRSNPDVVGRILLPTPDGGRVPLSQVADVAIHEGSFMIFCEGGRRYIPIKFSVRGRDLAATIVDLQNQMRAKINLPQGYTYTWAGEFDSLRKEQQRLAIIIPISLLVIFLLLYLQFQRWGDALIVLATLPFCAIGGILTLLITRMSFSISAAVGFTSLIGVATLAAVVFLSGIRRIQRTHPGAGALMEGALEELRPVLMACLAAGLGLLPAAMINAIGAQAQQPLARVVVGGMVTTIFSVLFLIPLMTSATQPATPLVIEDGMRRTQAGEDSSAPR